MAAPRRSHAQAALIAVDWGTSRLRARLVDAQRRGARRGGERRRHRPDRRRPRGGLRAAGRATGRRCRRSWPAWSAAGRAGARRPTSPARRRRRRSPRAIAPLHDGARTADRDRARSMLRAPARDGDVIRGEETQIVGLIDREPGFAGIAILPGTHSKWARIDDGAIADFQTFLTGEMFELLSQHSFLRHSVAEGGGDLVRVAGLRARRPADGGGRPAVPRRDLLGARPPAPRRRRAARTTSPISPAWSSAARSPRRGRAGRLQPGARAPHRRRRGRWPAPIGSAFAISRLRDARRSTASELVLGGPRPPGARDRLPAGGGRA